MEKLLTALSEERKRGLEQRLSEEESPAEAPPAPKPGRDYRTRQQRDRDRILYSGAFQRLAYVTQVTAPESGHTFHNRLSHSLKVAQVGRRNAERLTSLVKAGNITGKAAELVAAMNPDAVEASCLAHDLGHPPFGHIAEEVLQACGSHYVPDAFEGNAQSFRVVTRLAVRTKVPGLDLTRQTLDGLLKYPWRHWPKDPAEGQKRERKWGYYTADDTAFAFARAGWPAEERETLPERCLEAELMEWADDLTYAVHDVDDFFRAGLVPLDRLANPKDPEANRFARLLTDARDDAPHDFPKYGVDELVAAAQDVIGLYGPVERYEHTVDARATMRDFGSKLITRYLDAFWLEDEADGDKIRLRIDDTAEREVAALKMLVVAYVVRRPGLAVVQHGQKRLIGDLFQRYFDASSPGGTGDRRLFPPGARERLADVDDSADQRARVVVDLISGLTEDSAIQLHRRLSGGWAAPALDATALVG